MGSLPRDISGSRAAAILGFNSFKTRAGVWLDIMEERSPGFSERHGFKYEPFEGNAATKWGSSFEENVIKLADTAQWGSSFKDSVVNLARMATNDEIYDRERAFNHPRLDYLTCHVDGVYAGDPRASKFGKLARKFKSKSSTMGDKTLHEGKTTVVYILRDRWGEPGSDRIPEEIQIQVQHQLLVTEAPRAIVSVLAFPKRQQEWEDMGIDPSLVAAKWARILNDMGYFHQYHVEANPELHAAMLPAYVDFWANNVLGEEPPEPANYSDIRMLITAPQGTVIACEKLDRWATEYKAINGELRKIKKRKDQLKTLLIAEMNARADRPVDDDSVEKLVLRDMRGNKLCQYDGKTFR